MPPRNRKNGRGKNRRRKPQVTSSAVIGRPSYKGDVVMKTKLPGIPYVLTTTVTTGVIASGTVLDVQLIKNFASRFITYNFFRVLKIRVRCTPLGPNTGLSVLWFDDNIAGATSLLVAQESASNKLSNNSANSKTYRTMKWTPSTLANEAYALVANGTGPDTVLFNVYTDSANYGAPVVATQLWLIEPDFTVEFKGFKAV